MNCPRCGAPIPTGAFACTTPCWKMLSRSLRTAITSYPHRFKDGDLERRAHAEWAQVPGKRSRRRVA